MLITSLSCLYFIKENENKYVDLINEMQYKEDLFLDVLINNVSASSSIIYDFESIKDSILQNNAPPFLFYRYSENMCISCILMKTYHYCENFVIKIIILRYLLYLIILILERMKFF